MKLKLLSICVCVVGVITAVFLIQPAPTIIEAADCGVTSIGATPITDLGTGLYLGKQGGLYPGGKNTRPAAHEAAGLTIAQSIQPLNAQGNVDSNGVVVLASMGMSNVFQEFGAFEPLAYADPDMNEKIVLANLAQPGTVAQRMANPNDLYWHTRVPKSLEKLNLTKEQVQIVWLKQNRGYPDESFPEFAELLQEDLIDIVQIAHDTFPNLKMIFVSSRIYAGYSTDDLNPEPYSYQSAFGFKWLVEAQINGDPRLNYDPAKGEVQAPHISWGPYMWADGMTPRSDGLIWECSDLEPDGVHPDVSGEQKVATFLLNFFKTDALTTPWFGEGNPLPTPTPGPNPTATPNPGAGGDILNYLPIIRDK